MSVLGEIIDRGVQSSIPPHTECGLTKREFEVIKMVAEDFHNKIIAQSLGISIKTVEKIRTRAYHRLGVHTGVGACRYMIKHGYVTV